MISKSFVQTLNQTDARFRKATTLEDVLCYTVLVANKVLNADVDTVNTARDFWLGMEGSCENCPFNKNCIACIINQ